MNPKHEFEVYTTADKAKRDELYAALRTSGDPFEKQAVRFSGWEPVMGEDGGQRGKYVSYHRVTGRAQWRPLYRSTWSVAHPKAENAPKGRS
jgi:hypothetical protein